MMPYENSEELRRLLSEEGLVDELKKPEVYRFIAMHATGLKYACSNEEAIRLLKDKKASFGDMEDIGIISDAIIELAAGRTSMATKIDSATTKNDNEPMTVVIGMAIEYLNIACEQKNDRPGYIW